MKKLNILAEVKKIFLMYPELPFESKKIKKLRRKIQKPFASEAIDAWLLYRRISIYLSLFISKFKWIAPNYITFFAVFIVILYFIISSFILTSERIIIFGFLVYNISSLLDMVDGELARLHSRYSIIGVWMDRILEFLLYAVILIVGFESFKIIDLNLFSLLVLAIFLNLGSKSGYKEIIFLNFKEKNNLPTTNLRKNKVFINFISLIASPTLLIFLLTFFRKKYVFIGIIIVTISKSFFQIIIYLHNLYNIEKFD